MQYLENLLAKIDRTASNYKWTNTYGIARSLMALGLLITLSFNDISTLIHPLGEENSTSFFQTVYLTKINLFELVNGQLELGRWISIGILLLVIIGWYPQITGVLHWWVTLSFANSAMVLDGGDQVAQVLTLLLIPICLAEPRRSHWQHRNSTENQAVPFYRKALNLLAYSTMIIIALQVSLIYLHAGIGKLSVEEWANGTAMFYWIQNPIFGVDGEPHADLFYQLFANPYMVSLVTWGVILFEIVLFMGLLLKRRQKNVVLVLGLVFHLLNIVLFGLVSFFFTMAAALLLYLGPHESGIPLNISFRKVPRRNLSLKPFLRFFSFNFNIK
jgi:antimicrobial peptide system SdpB family protein